MTPTICTVIISESDDGLAAHGEIPNGAEAGTAVNIAMGLLLEGADQIFKLTGKRAMTVAVAPPPRKPHPNLVQLLKEPTPITWTTTRYGDTSCEEALVNNYMVAWLTMRPSYCDRGHWQVDCSLPDIDGADRFPRFYMRHETAVEETEAFLRWRLWKQRSPR